VRKFCLALIVGLSSIVYAKDSYHVNELVSMVIKNHPNIKMQEHMIRGADAQIESAKWNYFPTLSFSANQGVNQNKAWDGTAVVSQPLWTGGKLDATYDMAIANRYNSESGLGESGYMLVEMLLNALKTYLKSQGDLKALSEGQKQLNILKDMLARRIEAGVSSKSDMELLRARLYQMQTDINYAKASMQASLSQIELLTNHDFKGKLEVKGRTSFDFASLDKMIKAMIKTHPTLKKYDALIDYAEAEKSQAEAVFMPNVSLKVQRGAGSNDYYYNDTTRETRVYVAVDASFGAGLSAVSGIEQAEAKIMQLRQEKLSTQQDLINKIMFAYNDYISSSSRVNSQSGSISSSQKVFESYTRLFLAGKRQWLDLVNTSRELTQNQMAFAETESTLLVSAYQLLLLSGKSDMMKMLPDTGSKEPTRTASSEEAEKVFIPSMNILPGKEHQKTKEDKGAAGQSDTAAHHAKGAVKTAEYQMLKAAIRSEAKEEEARIAKAKIEAAKRRKEEEAKVAKAKAEAEQRRKEEEARVAKAEAEKRRKAEEARIAKAKAEAEAKVAKAKAEAEQRRKEEEARVAKAEAEKRRKAEEVRIAKAKAEQRRKSEEARVAKEEQKSAGSTPASPKYYVQFDLQLDEAMKKKFEKQNLKISTTEDGQQFVGSYERAAEALAAAREIRNIIYDEAYIVRK
jgi:adhesin transport system outer membrane protein